MLRRSALAILLTLLACESANDTLAEPTSPAAIIGYAAVYFEHDERLVPEYHRLASGEPAHSVWDVLVGGPNDPELDSAIPEGAELLQVAEPEEGRLLLELDEAFWQRPDDEVYRAAAQIVYSLSSVEGGRAITLIDELGPGVVRNDQGRELPQPLSQEDFPAPLIRVTQPVAGATVGTSIPIDVTLVPHRSATATLEVDGEEIAAERIRSGIGRLVANEAPSGPAVVRIQIDSGPSVEVPIVIAGGD